ncbi:hypothetical protein [Streptomyces luteogriseus]|uniref:hypothetical protein n=1 Tax=Streptomyces luteogriseus TaxID=68233 RepID=UPI003809E852
MERTQTIDAGEVLASVLTEPSYPAQILTVTARLVELDMFTSVTPWSLDQHVTTAEATILVNSLPEAVHHDASTRARNALPQPYSGTPTEYARQLRTAAKAL